jgi:hypothetical protein
VAQPHIVTLRALPYPLVNRLANVIRKVTGGQPQNSRTSPQMLQMRHEISSMGGMMWMTPMGQMEMAKQMNRTGRRAALGVAHEEVPKAPMLSRAMPGLSRPGPYSTV